MSAPVRRITDRQNVSPPAAAGGSRASSGTADLVVFYIDHLRTICRNRLGEIPHRRLNAAPKPVRGLEAGRMSDLAYAQIGRFQKLPSGRQAFFEKELVGQGACGGLECACEMERAEPQDARHFGDAQVAVQVLAQERRDPAELCD